MGLRPQQRIHDNLKYMTRVGLERTSDLKPPSVILIPNRHKYHAVLKPPGGAVR